MRPTKAVILAAGEGKRMYPFTHIRPKVMLPFANRPIAEHLLIELREAGIREVLFVVGYRNEKIREYFGDGSKWDISIQYATQKNQLGTADALRQVSWWAKDRFILANGDVVVGREDIEALSESVNPAMCLSAQDNVTGLGVVELRGSRVVRIHEKKDNPPGNLVNTGLYLLTPHIFAAVDATRPSTRGEYELTDSLQILVDTGVALEGHKINNWLNFTYPWDLLEANAMIMKDLQPDIRGVIEAGAHVQGPLVLGANSTVRAGSYIIGPAIIGDSCDIGPNCYIRPSTSVGDRCHIGASVEIKNSIVMAGAKVPHHNYVGDSVIGERCNLGAGTKTANLRLDRSIITSCGVNTGRKKLGALIGDEVQTGINASIDVGSAIGSFSVIGPGALVRGTVQPNSMVM